jgi:hypothetical protein
MKRPHGGKASLATQGKQKYTTQNAYARKAVEIQVHFLLSRLSRVSISDWTW